MGRGSSYVGEDDIARFVKICHNVLLGVVIQNLAEITVLAEKAGVSRAAFLDFLNNSVMGSMFSRYKTPALVNLDYSVTFTPELLLKDLDLGLAAARDRGVPMPVASAARRSCSRSSATATAGTTSPRSCRCRPRPRASISNPENVDVSDGLSG